MVHYSREIDISQLSISMYSWSHHLTLLLLRMVSIIMWISPVGIASVISAKILMVSNLASIMSQLGYFILTVCGGIFLYQFTFLQAIYFLATKKNPFQFWWGIFQAWMTAFATAST